MLHRFLKVGSTRSGFSLKIRDLGNKSLENLHLEG